MPNIAYVNEIQIIDAQFLQTCLYRLDRPLTAEVKSTVGFAANFGGQVIGIARHTFQSFAENQFGFSAAIEGRSVDEVDSRPNCPSDRLHDILKAAQQLSSVGTEHQVFADMCPSCDRTRQLIRRTWIRFDIDPDSRSTLSSLSDRVFCIPVCSRFRCLSIAEQMSALMWKTCVYQNYW